MDKIKSELIEYYTSMRDIWSVPTFQDTANKILDQVKAAKAADPSTPAILIKSKLHTLIAKHFEPKLFETVPFFFEMGLKPSACWGVHAPLPHKLFDESFSEREKNNADTAAANKNMDAFRVPNPIVIPANSYTVFRTTNRYCVDLDHHTLGYTRLMSHGINGILAEISTMRQTSDNPFLQAAEESCLAVLAIAEKFAQKAESLLQNTTSEEGTRNLTLIAQTARHIPARPPKTFYEGLAMLLFMREVSATMEGIGISVVGHVDRLLGPLYEADLAAKRITEEEARKLLAIFMIHTDIRWDVMHNSWPETSTCIQLGGCDEEGKPLYNEITRLVIEVHEALHLLNPKLNCRYSSSSPEEYLQLIAASQLRGHNNFALLCDDVIFTQLQNSGISQEDARLYVNGGCQETMIEGKGHSSGANTYLLLPRLLNLSLNAAELPSDIFSPTVQEAIPKVITDAPTFEDFYRLFMKNTEILLRFFLGSMAEVGKHHRNLNPCPLYSLTQEGCIESGLDYTAGGAKYNSTTICACGLATVADSLFAIRHLVYETGELTLGELAHILATDWKDAEPLRNRCCKLPKYGHGNPEADALCRRYFRDLNQIIISISNERGGNYILSEFVYYLYKTFAPYISATPDGRKNGEYLSQGIAAGRLQQTTSALNMINSVQSIDFSMQGGNAVLDLQMPLSTGLTPELLAGFIRGAGQSGIPTLQLNFVSPEQLRKAQQRPEDHTDLIVRICGLSAYFVQLLPDVQDEIINRNLLNPGN